MGLGRHPLEAQVLGLGSRHCVMSLYAVSRVFVALIDRASLRER